MPEFNIEQRAAIVAENPFLLCAAGAGSGKTTVMVESVVHKLRGNAAKDIANFLIITFTNEAAGNMKRKIQERLTKDAFMPPEAFPIWKTRASARSTPFASA